MRASLFAAVLLALPAPSCLAWGSRKAAKKRAATIPAAPAAAPNPLDPLTAAEIDATVGALRSSKLFDDSAAFLSIGLQEPAKDETAPESRQAFALVYDRDRRETSEAVVDLGAQRLESWRLVPGVEPGLSDAEASEVRKLVFEDQRWQDAMRARGIASWDEVSVDAWTPGPLDAAKTLPHRVARTDFYAGSGSRRRALAGLSALVDLTARKVVELKDDGPGPAFPQAAWEQPVLPSTDTVAPFTLAGHEISWQNWRFRFGLAPREGLTLYRVRYGVPARGVIGRASVSESFVLYGDPKWASRSIYQEAERGLGRRSLPLEPGIDAPATASFIDEAGVDGAGRGRVLPKAVAVYERAPHELVITSKAQVGPEDYTLSWIFEAGGELRADAAVCARAELPAHQHFFNYRLDFDVDGATDSVDELEAAPQRPGAAGFALRRAPLATSAQARRDVDAAAARRWLISPSSDAASGYLLIPMGNAAPLAASGSAARRAAPFLDHQLWITAYHPDELYAAGEYPGRRARAGGVERWTQRDEPIRDGDVVLWYTLGATHLPSEASERPLEAGFRLVPYGR